MAGWHTSCREGPCRVPTPRRVATSGTDRDGDALWTASPPLLPGPPAWLWPQRGHSPRGGPRSTAAPGRGEANVASASSSCKYASSLHQSASGFCRPMWKTNLKKQPPRGSAEGALATCGPAGASLGGSLADRSPGGSPLCSFALIASTHHMFGGAVGTTAPNNRRETRRLAGVPWRAGTLPAKLRTPGVRARGSRHGGGRPLHPRVPRTASDTAVICRGTASKQNAGVELLPRTSRQAVSVGEAFRRK